MYKWLASALKTSYETFLRRQSLTRLEFLLFELSLCSLVNVIREISQLA